MIGTVEYVEDELDNLFKKGKIRFSIDYNRLTHVYVVENTFREELKQLNMGTQDE
jgi:cell shape-determining protein MreC